MQIRNGAPVVGDNFFPRKDIEDKLMRALERDHVSFLGPRRTGKTSILLHFDSAPPSRFVPIYLDLEEYNNALSWLESMFNQIKRELEGSQEQHWRQADSLRKNFGEFCEGLKEITIAGTSFKFKDKDKTLEGWQNVANQFLDLLIKTDESLLIMLDEFPWFLQFVAEKTSESQVEEVLQWFRGARQKLAKANKRTRFLVTGSIGLNAVVRRLGLAPSINDFDVIEIQPLSAPEALDFLQRLGEHNGVKLTELDRRQILQLLGANWPILLQFFILEILEAEHEGDCGSLEQIYERRLVAGPRNPYCQSMYDRLKNIFPISEFRLAGAILRKLARAKAGMTREEFEAMHEKLVPEPELRGGDMDNVLDSLRHDGYIVQQSGEVEHWLFASNILRDFWKRKTA